MGTIAAGSLTTVANAGEWGHRDRGGNTAYVYQNNSGYGHHGQRMAYGNYSDHRDYSHHNRHRNRGLAIGAFAAILGLALVAGANNRHDRDDDYGNYRDDYRH